MPPSFFFALLAHPSATVCHPLVSRPLACSGPRPSRRARADLGHRASPRRVRREWPMPALLMTSGNPFKSPPRRWSPLPARALPPAVTPPTVLHGCTARPAWRCLRPHPYVSTCMLIHLITFAPKLHAYSQPRTTANAAHPRNTLRSIAWAGSLPEPPSPSLSVPQLLPRTRREMSARARWPSTFR